LTAQDVALEKGSLFLADVRDHRWLLVARTVPVERSGTSTEHDAGRYSVDRIVGLFSLCAILGIPRMMADNQNPNTYIKLSEQEIVGKPFQVHSLVAADPIVESLGMLNCLQNFAAKLIVEFLSESQIGYILIISHDCVNF
jgi:hypothetical protein